MNVVRTLNAFVSGVCLLWTLTAGAQGTAITYQGRLGSDSTPANGTFDFTFSVHDAVSGGTQIGLSATNPAVAVNSGLFVVTLDFGPGVFNGASRWLEIGVRTNRAEAFTVLSPRQPFTATPYALYVPTAGTALTAQSANTVAAGSVGAAGLQNGAVDSSKIADDAITSSDLSSVLRNGTFWRLDGNGGTTAGTHFLGTTDPQALELKVNGQRALRLEPTTNSPNLIGGFAGNFVSNDVVGATIGGGGGDGLPNRIVSYPSEWAPLSNAVPDFSTISGGVNNEIRSGKNNLVAGGASNSIVGWNRSLGSGDNNSIVGGARNRVENAVGSGILGGEGNQIVGSDDFGLAYSTIVGGVSNRIYGGSNSISPAFIGGGNENVFWPNASGTILGFRNSIGSNSFGNVNGSANSIQANSTGTIAGGSGNRIDGDGVISGGDGNWTSGVGSTIGGGKSNWVTASYGTIPGGVGAKTHTYGQFAHASGQFANQGDAQTSVYVCRITTTNTVPTVLSPDGSSARVTVPENSTWSFHVLVIGAGRFSSAGYEIRGVIERDGDTTALVGTPNVTLLGEKICAGCSANVIADDANDAVAVTVTGVESNWIQWVARIRTVEVSF